jgi:hypothetical protein
VSFTSCASLNARWAEGENSSLEHFRTQQLEMRIREVYEVYHGFKKLILSEGPAEKVTIAGMDEKESVAWIESFRNSVDLDDLTLTGHSFGGGTIVCHAPFRSLIVRCTYYRTHPQILTFQPCLSRERSPSIHGWTPSHSLPPTRQVILECPLS